MTLLGHRREGYRVELLSRDDNTLGDVDGVEGGALAWNANATLPGGGSIELIDRSQDINLSRDRMRIWWDVEGYGEWPLGVYVLAAPSTQYHADSISRSITLIDKLTVIRDNCLTSTLQISAGANIVEAARTQILACDEYRIAHTQSSSVLSNAMTWDPGTSRLRVINDLLDAAGYWALWTDALGQFRLEPYIAPVYRPIAWTFKEGATSIHSPDWEHELSLWEATNTVVMVSQADDSGATFKAVAIDSNPNSPTSTVSMGRVLNPIVEENVEASSQADLQTQANRKLLDNSNVVGKLAVSHAPVPLWYNQAVQFQSQGINTRATVTKMSLNLVPGSLIYAEWRQA